MEAKDTVMEHNQVLPYWSGRTLRIDELLEAQAEISFKAGYNQGVIDSGAIKRKHIQAHGDICYKAGIKTVVEEFSKWFREQSWDINGGAYIIPKMVLDRKLLMLKEPFKPSSGSGD